MANSKDHFNIYQGMVEQPLAPPVLRIGIAGSRRLNETQIEAINQQLPPIYQSIQSAIQKVNQNPLTSQLYSRTSIDVRFISSLAEGVDRLAINSKFINFEHEIAAILPFSIDTYAKDFAPERSVIDSNKGTLEEFNQIIETIKNQVDSQENTPLIELGGDDSTAATREAAYHYCSEILVNHCDILIAIYDGDNLENTGTTATVNAAKAQRIPVIYISTNKPADTKLICHHGDQIKPSEDLLSGTEKRNELINQEIQSILLFSDFFKETDKENQQKIIERLQSYCSSSSLKFSNELKPDFNYLGPINLKKEYKNSIASLFNNFKNKFPNKKRVDDARKKLVFKEDEEPPSNQENTHNNTNHYYYSAFLRADRLANYFSNIHRSTFLLIYLLAGIALVIATLAIAFKTYKLLGLYLGIAEILVLLGIYKLYRDDHHHEYHARWLEYRCLAEFLRPMHYLSRLGKNYRIRNLRHPADYLGRKYVGHKSIARSWLYIYVQTIIRSAGFGHNNLNGDKKQNSIRFINHRWLNSQIQYHINNAARTSVISHKLEKISTTLFYATLAAVALKILLTSLYFIVGFKAPSALSTIVVLCTAIFPILAAIAFAIRNHAEFDISSQRSLSMRASLNTHSKLIANKAAAQEPTNDIINELQQVAGLTIKEAAEWLEIYEIKEAELG